MRKLTPTEIALLHQHDKPPIDFGNGRKWNVGLWPWERAKGTSCTTVRNLYKLGLLKVYRCSLVEHYPLELTDEGREVLRQIKESEMVSP